MKECLCIPWDMVHSNQSQNNYSLCDSFGNQCFYHKMRNSTYMHANCQCYPRCNTTYYAYNIDSQLPIKKQKECENSLKNPGFYYNFRKWMKMTPNIVTFREKLMENSSPKINTNEKDYLVSKCLSSFEKDVAIIEVKIEGNSHVILKKSLKYTITDKIGTIGGSLGLFTGFSFMALVEILYWILVTITKIVMIPIRNSILT